MHCESELLEKHEPIESMDSTDAGRGFEPCRLFLTSRNGFWASLSSVVPKREHSVRGLFGRLVAHDDGAGRSYRGLGAGGLRRVQYPPVAAKRSEPGPLI